MTWKVALHRAVSGELQVQHETKAIVDVLHMFYGEPAYLLRQK
jgi:hypothetical protein